MTLSGMQTLPIVQPLIASQGTTILGSQPLYIRTADTLQQQQGIMGNVQTVTQTRRKNFSSYSITKYIIHSFINSLRPFL